MNDIYIWFAESDTSERSGERFIRAWTDNPERVAGLREAIGREPMVYRSSTPAVDSGALPPLPEPASVKRSGFDAGDYFSADQMREYARASISSAIGQSTEAAEPIYQIRVTGIWIDTPKLNFEKWSHEKRIVYTAPPAASGQKLTDLTAKLTFLLRTNLQRLDDETLAQLDAVENELALLRASSATASDKEGA